MRRIHAVAVLTVLLAMASGLVGAETGAPGQLSVELTHPQADDQGHYVACVRGSRVTVFGLIVPADEVRGVSVNGRQAQLFPGAIPPFGATKDDAVTEFRATVQMGRGAPLKIRIEQTDGTVTHALWAADTGAVTSRLRALVAADPDNGRSRCRLAGALRCQGNYAEAIREYQKVLGVNSDCARTRVELAKALLAIGQVDEARDELALATEIDAENAGAWLHLGLLHARYTRDANQAVGCLQRYLKLEPDGSIADKVSRYVASVSS